MKLNTLRKALKPKLLCLCVWAWKWIIKKERERRCWGVRDLQSTAGVANFNYVCISLFWREKGRGRGGAIPGEGRPATSDELTSGKPSKSQTSISAAAAILGVVYISSMYVETNALRNSMPISIRARPFLQLKFFCSSFQMQFFLFHKSCKTKLSLKNQIINWKIKHCFKYKQ